MVGYQKITGATKAKELSPDHFFRDNSPLGGVRDQRLNGNGDCQTRWGDPGQSYVVAYFACAAAAFFPGNHPPLLFLLKHGCKVRAGTQAEASRSEERRVGKECRSR